VSMIDCRYEVLVTFFGSQGQTNDMLLAYVQDLITTRHVAETPADQITDAWFQLFTLDGFTGAKNDMQLAWLQGEGAMGNQITDLWEDYWCNVLLGSAFSSGFSNGFN